MSDMREKSRDTTNQSNDVPEEKFYCCESINGIYCYITTNDEAHAEKLINDGGVLLCHPALFSAISNRQSEVGRLVPFVIRLVHTHRGNRVQGQYVPTGMCESALATTY
ncbi:hypothetical protein [Propionispira arboris]|nr:hypothetical protein [Propionispira arboris]